jgi:hypothetical protein
MSMTGGTARDTQSAGDAVCPEAFVGGGDIIWPATLIGGGTGPGVAVLALAIGELASGVAPIPSEQATTASDLAW